MAFLPSKDGFKFVNSFPGFPLPPDISRKLPEPAESQSFGLCGGMSAAAMDYYINKMPVPQTTSVPKNDDPLYRFLYQRQLSTLGDKKGFEYAFKFVNWMLRPGGNKWFLAGTRKLTSREYPKIAKELKTEDGFAVLGLVQVGATDKMKVWENHQVLGYHVEETPNLRSFVISIYDPNYPGQDDITISGEEVIAGRHPIFFWQKENGFKCVEHVPARYNQPARDIALRGLFIIKVETSQPPNPA